MKDSKALLLWLAAHVATVVNAHTIFTTMFVNDVSQGDGTCVRMNMDDTNSTSPILNLSSDDMACGANGLAPVAFTCSAAAGSKLTFEWRMWADLEQPGVLDPSHKGPCALYIKQVSNMSTTSAGGPGWLKIWDEGYDDSTGKWCTEKLIDAGGLMSFDIPSVLPAGNWLFRPELLALHNTGAPEFYIGCAQVFVESRNTGPLEVPAEYSVSIPGAIKGGDASVTFNIYEPVFPYPLPGPAVYNVPALPTSSSLSQSLNSPIQMEGLIPSDCILKNANWCGVEVTDYSTEAGCWSASDACFAQAQTCYDSASPIGIANCKVWEAKCDGINDACSAGNFVGPPNKDAKLATADPAPPAAIPPAFNLGAGPSASSASDGVGSAGSSTSVSGHVSTLVPSLAASSAGYSSSGEGGDGKSEDTASDIGKSFTTSPTSTPHCKSRSRIYQRYVLKN